MFCGLDFGSGVSKRDRRQPKLGGTPQQLSSPERVGICCVFVSLSIETILADWIGGAFEMTATVFQKSDSHETDRNIRKPQRGPESF